VLILIVLIFYTKDAFCEEKIHTIVVILEEHEV
jgi:hypothetical protein